MKKFNEQALIAGLCDRESDAMVMKNLFDPNWLKDAELKPVLRAIFEYMDKENAVPSLPSLSAFMEDKDKAKFDARYHTTLAQLVGYDTKSQMYAINRAKEAAAAYSLHYLIHEQRFQQMLTDGKAEDIKQELAKWLSSHTESEDEGLFSVQEAFDKLLDDHPWQGKAAKVATGIKPIDDWAGGLRPPQMGIVMAPTGHGKSAILMNIAYHAAAIEDKTVLFITNELTINEQTERFLVRMQNPALDSQGKFDYHELTRIQDDPSIAYTQLTGYRQTLNKKLFIYSANLGQTADGIDEICKRVRMERGVWPDMIVVDYLERMSTVVNMDRGSTWTYFGQIAKELVGLAKRRQVILWTAIQTNRSGMNANNALGMDSAQGSIQHFQESALAVGVRKVQVSKPDGTIQKGLEFQEMKARHGAMESRKMIIEVDLGRMWLSDNEIEPLNDMNVDDDDDTKPAKGKKKAKTQAQTKGKA